MFTLTEGLVELQIELQEIVCSVQAIRQHAQTARHERPSQVSVVADVFELRVGPGCHVAYHAL